MTRRTNRRDFLKQTTLAGVGFWAAGGVTLAQPKAANDKLNIAVIGAGGQGGGNLNNIAGQGENIVALCDVDEKRAANGFNKFTSAKKYHDFRKMLDEMGKEIDAVVVSTPDHTHAPASMMAMKMGKHVYCEKPLTHTVYEARVMRETAAKMKVATQMGNQGHASGGCRGLVEVIRSGVIGKIKEAHGWCPKNFSARSRPKETPEVPNTLDWDVWLGPAPERPYHPTYLPFNWRAWWDFGTGGLGDMACHILDPIFWGLELAYPVTVEADGDPKENTEGFQTHLTVRYEFPKRGDAGHQDAVTVYWHHGDRIPQKTPIKGVELPADLKLPDEAVMLIGEQGVIIGDRGPGLIALLPKEKFADFKKPNRTLPRSPGHTEEWFQACKGGPAALSNFGYAALLTETVLLGNVAWRMGKKLEWDGKAMKATNCPEAETILKREYRRGWTL
jgi:predicted dehydrogenase